MCIHAQCLSHSTLFAVPRTVEPTKLPRPWNFPGKNTGVGCHFLLQGIFPTQGSNLWLPCLLLWQANSLSLCLLSVCHLQNQFESFKSRKKKKKNKKRFCILTYPSLRLSSYPKCPVLPRGRISVGKSCLAYSFCDSAELSLVEEAQ